MLPWNALWLRRPSCSGWKGTRILSGWPPMLRCSRTRTTQPGSLTWLSSITIRFTESPLITWFPCWESTEAEKWWKSRTGAGKSLRYTGEFPVSCARRKAFCLEMQRWTDSPWRSQTAYTGKRWRTGTLTAWPSEQGSITLPERAGNGMKPSSVSSEAEISGENLWCGRFSGRRSLRNIPLRSTLKWRRTIRWHFPSGIIIPRPMRAATSRRIGNGLRGRSETRSGRYRTAKAPPECPGSLTSLFPMRNRRRYP